MYDAPKMIGNVKLHHLLGDNFRFVPFVEFVNGEGPVFPRAVIDTKNLETIAALIRVGQDNRDHGEVSSRSWVTVLSVGNGSDPKRRLLTVYPLMVPRLQAESGSPSASRGLRNELPFILAAIDESITRISLGIDEGGYEPGGRTRGARGGNHEERRVERSAHAHAWSGAVEVRFFGVLTAVATPCH